MRAASLLAKGLSQSEVARRVGAHRQSVSKWAAELEAKPYKRRENRYQVGEFVAIPPMRWSNDPSATGGANIYLRSEILLVSFFYLYPLGSKP
jgi:hypothetical protein